MKVKDIVEALEQFAPLSIQEGWDTDTVNAITMVLRKSRRIKI